MKEKAKVNDADINDADDINDDDDDDHNDDDDCDVADEDQEGKFPADKTYLEQRK